MKVEINNLTALIQGRDLNLYQRSLAVEEFHKLLNHVKEMEQALSIANTVGRSEQLVCDHQWKSRFSEKRGSWRLCAKCSKEG
jgi:hypothetical protein